MDRVVFVLMQYISWPPARLVRNWKLAELTGAIVLIKLKPGIRKREIILRKLKCWKDLTAPAAKARKNMDR